MLDGEGTVFEAPMRTRNWPCGPEKSSSSTCNPTNLWTGSRPSGCMKTRVGNVWNWSWRAELTRRTRWEQTATALAARYGRV